ncbi:hypothetical protein BDK88_3864 [Natrinema hispanicum]|uniref:Uncharacterized protein n=1 Tax=Natrinema hispanicum TaxID=392421 RepID=A0A482Y7Z2_9EURY|nr:hypothetical protein BDK88_3864 [Natrinema hispanicum]
MFTEALHSISITDNTLLDRVSIFELDICLPEFRIADPDNVVRYHVRSCAA